MLPARIEKTLPPAIVTLCAILLTLSFFISLLPAPSGIVNSSTHLPLVQDSTNVWPNSSRPVSDSHEDAAFLRAKEQLREQLQATFPYNRSRHSRFPNLIWQTWKNRPGEEGFPAELSWSETTWSKLHPSHIHMTIDDTQARELVRSLFASLPVIFDVFTAMPLSVHRADFFRYLILLALGGTYSDIDTTALKPISTWLDEKETPEEEVGLIVGIEADANRPDWSQWYARRVQLCQWTIRAKPGHPILADIVAKIVQHTLRMRSLGILHTGAMDLSTVFFTGPGIWTDTVLDYWNDETRFTEQDRRRSAPIPLGKNVTVYDLTDLIDRKVMGDTVLLPITSFSPGQGHMGSKPADDPMAFVKHNFQGSWKDNP